MEAQVGVKCSGGPIARKFGLDSNCKGQHTSGGAMELAIEFPVHRVLSNSLNGSSMLAPSSHKPTFNLT